VRVVGVGGGAAGAGDTVVAGLVAGGGAVVVPAFAVRVGRGRTGRRGRGVVPAAGRDFLARVRARVRPVLCPAPPLVAGLPAARDGFARRRVRPAVSAAGCRSAGRRGATGRGAASGAVAGATGAAAAAGRRGEGADRRGQSTTRATIAGSATRRATFPQRTRRSSESGSMNAVGIGRGGFAPCYRAPPLMAAPAPIYDLVVLLDTTAPDEQRAKILADAEAMITNGGSVVSKHDWGPRTMAYEIRHKTDAEYHLIQFHGSAQLLENLQRTLRITDGVVRFRIIKLEPGTPDPPPKPERAPVEPAEAPAAA